MSNPSMAVTVASDHPVVLTADPNGQAFRIPDEYSPDGAWQQYVDLRFLKWVLEEHLSEATMVV